MDDRINELLSVQPEYYRQVIKQMELLRSKYIKMPRDQVLADQFDRLFYRSVQRRDVTIPPRENNRTEMRGMVVVGETGAGKTRSLRRLFGGHPALSGYGEIGSPCPLITVSVPSPSTLKLMGIATLRQLGYELARDKKEWDVWKQVRFHLRERRILCVHYDEAQHVLQNKTSDEVEKIANTCKDLQLNTEWPVMTILSGLPRLVRFSHLDRQFGRRQMYLRFDTVSVASLGRTLTSIVRSYSEAAGLAPVILEHDDFMPRLVHAACSAFGLVIEVTLDAIEEALYTSASALRLEHFEAAYARRTGCDTRFNPFLSPEWATIDTRRVMTTETNREEEDPPGSKPRTGRNRRSKW